ARDGRAMSISDADLLKLRATGRQGQQSLVPQWIGLTIAIGPPSGGCSLTAQPRPTGGSTGRAFLGLDAGRAARGWTRVAPAALASRPRTEKISRRGGQMRHRLEASCRVMLAAWALAIGGDVLADDAPGKRPVTPEDTYSLRTISALDVAPDGRSLAYVVD